MSNLQKNCCFISKDTTIGLLILISFCIVILLFIGFHNSLILLSFIIDIIILGIIIGTAKTFRSFSIVKALLILTIIILLSLSSLYIHHLTNLSYKNPQLLSILFVMGLVFSFQKLK